MPALHNAWRIVCRFIAPFDEPADAARTGRVHGCDEPLEPMHGGGGWLCEAWDRVGQQARETQRQDELARRNELRMARRSRRRALTLLMRVLNSDQRQEFRKFRHVLVVGGHSGDRYRIRDATFANIDVLRADGTVAYRLCAHPAGAIPVYDVMAAQLLHLQDPVTEQRFVQQAFIHPAPEQFRVGAKFAWFT
jgi:hypothetical protein